MASEPVALNFKFVNVGAPLTPEMVTVVAKSPCPCAEFGVSPSSKTREVGVGETFITVNVTVLFASKPSTLKFLAALENLLLATLTTPSAVLLDAGVNVAV